MELPFSYPFPIKQNPIDFLKKPMKNLFLAGYENQKNLSVYLYNYMVASYECPAIRNPTNHPWQSG